MASAISSDVNDCRRDVELGYQTDQTDVGLLFGADMLVEARLYNRQSLVGDIAEDHLLLRSYR